MLIHPQLDGAFEGLQVVLRCPLLPTNDGLHSMSDVLHTMRRQLLFIVINELHRSTTIKQGVKQRIVKEGSKMKLDEAIVRVRKINM